MKGTYNSTETNETESQTPPHTQAKTSNQAQQPSTNGENANQNHGPENSTEDTAKDVTKQQVQPNNQEEASQQQSEGASPQKEQISELDKLQQENEELRESWQRERAEFVNFRKRIIQERQKQTEDTIASVVHELLPAFDNLDQVISQKDLSDEVKRYVDGVAMIRDNFVQILGTKHIKKLWPLPDQEFDPQTMEAISSEERKDISKDTVIEVYQAGYLLESEQGSKRLIRPARVRVGKPAHPSTAKTQDAGTGESSQTT